jgi:hypothetical protein
MMLRKSMVLILTLLILATTGPVVAEEMAKEGSASSKAYWIANMKMLSMGKEIVQINYEGYGVVVGDTEKSLVHNASAHVVGGMLVINGVYENESGFITYIRPDGDKIFVSFKNSGQMGKSAKGTGSIVGGTGKFVGITGTIEHNRHMLLPPAKGVSASFTVGKGSWKLP